MRRTIPALLVCLLSGCATQRARVAVPAGEGTARLGLGEYNLENAVALKGFDPVSYFPEGGGQPEAGDPAHALRHRGVVYHFSSRANRRRFEADPDRYEPAYGGWCAWAMARGFRVRVDPLHYTLPGDRLRLFYRNPMVDTRAKWLRGDYEELADAAGRHWKSRSGER